MRKRVNPAQHILIFGIRAYQRLLSPVLSVLSGPHAGCRYMPTCSVYAVQAIQEHGALAGFWLTVKRIARCQPWGGCGHDPVPKSIIPADISPTQFKSASHGS